MNILRFKVVAFVAGVAAVLIIFSLAQETNRRWQYQQEVRRLEQEVREVEKSTIALEHLNQYFRTDEYQERLAREKLNYRAPDEKVILIPHDQPLTADQKKGTNDSSDDTVSIPRLWWDLLFADSP